MVFNATFNNISVISWWSALLVDETGVPVENHRPDGSHWQSLSHIVISSIPPHELNLSEWLLFSDNSAIFQLYHGKNKLISNEMMMRSALY